jgi:predicted Zn-dependent peptidase
MWNVYFGCDPHDVNRCLNLVKKELRKLAEKPLTPSQLRAAQKQLKGQIGISCDNREGYALALGKTFAHYNVHRDVNNLYEEIDRLTPEQLQEIAREVYAEDKLSTLIYK